MAKITIYISLVPGITRLYLRDSEGHSGEASNFFTYVDSGDLITWELEKDSGIQEITNIYAKDGYFNILKDGAPKKFNSSWVGVVKDDAAGEDSYNIDYMINGEPFSDDPQLRTNP